KQQTQSKQSHYTRFYPGLDLLSTGVLRLVPEQQLRIHYPSSPPQGHLHTQPQLVFSSQPEEEYNTLEPSRSSFNTKGTTPWNPQVFLQHEGDDAKMCSRDDAPLDQANSTMLDPKRRLRGKDLQRRTLSVYKSSLKVLH
ncbi:hypothetical protein Taro_008751, partial [Colocasia esculenta]|nr:hypothetical protein [Colocasia esculenta]